MALLSSGYSVEIGSSSLPALHPAVDKILPVSALLQGQDQVPICIQSIPEKPRSLLFTPLCSSPWPQPFQQFGNS